MDKESKKILSTLLKNFSENKNEDEKTFLCSFFDASFDVGRKKSATALKFAMKKDQLIFLVLESVLPNKLLPPN